MYSEVYTVQSSLTHHSPLPPPPSSSGGHRQDLLLSCPGLAWLGLGRKVSPDEMGDIDIDSTKVQTRGSGHW